MEGSTNLKAYARALTAITMIAVWSLSALTGFLLWLAPIGPRSGRMPLSLGLTKHQWGDIHFWISVAALGVTLIHIAIDWRALLRYIRYFTSFHRGPGAGE